MGELMSDPKLCTNGTCERCFEGYIVYQGGSEVVCPVCRGSGTKTPKPLPDWDELAARNEDEFRERMREGG